MPVLVGETLLGEEVLKGRVWHLDDVVCCCLLLLVEDSGKFIFRVLGVILRFPQREIIAVGGGYLRMLRIRDECCVKLLSVVRQYWVIQFLLAAPRTVIALEEVAADVCPMLFVNGISNLEIAGAIGYVRTDIDGVGMIGKSRKGGCCQEGS